MIETERLRIRPMKLSDAEHVQALLLSEDFIANVGVRDVDTIEKARDYIQEKMINHYEQYGYGNNAILRKDDGAFIGAVGLFNRPNQEGVDIGYGILPDYHRKGYAYEAAEGLLAYAKNNLKLPFVDAFTMYENKASIKIIEKLGLTFLKEIFWEDDEVPSPMYRIIFKK